MQSDSSERQSLSKLRNDSSRGGVFLFSGQLLRIICQAGGLIALARLVTPEDHGLVAIVVAITGFFQIFRDAGLQGATVQRKEISSSELTNVFWLNLGLGAVVTCSVAALSPVVAWYFSDQRLVPLMLFLSLPFVIAASGSQHLAWLNRNMRFRPVAVISVSSAVIANLVAIGIALFNASYWAIATVPVTMAIVSSTAAWLCSGWRPGLPCRKTSIRGFAKFGVNIAAFDIVNYFARNADNLMIARVYGAVEVGVYAKAYQLFLLPLAQIKGPAVSVALPAMSRLQDRPEDFRRYYVQFLRILAFASMPIAAVILVFAEAIIRVTIGPAWSGVIPILQILAFGGIIQAVETTRGVVMLSLGDSGRYLRYGLGRSVVTVASFAVGIAWGPVGVAAACVAVSYICLYPSLAYCFAKSPVSPKDWFAAVALPFISCVGSALIAYFAIERRDWNPWVTLLFGVPLQAIIYITMLMSFKRGRQIVWSVSRIFTRIGPFKRYDHLAGRIIGRLEGVFADATDRMRSPFQRLFLRRTMGALSDDGDRRILLEGFGQTEDMKWIAHDNSWERISKRHEHRRQIIGGGGSPEVDDRVMGTPENMTITPHAMTFSTPPGIEDNWCYLYLEGSARAWGDSRVEFIFKKETEFREIQFGFRYQDFYNRYRFRIERGWLSFDIVRNAEFTNSVKRTRCSLVNGREYRVAIDSKGDEHVFWLDGVPLLRCRDPHSYFKKGSLTLIFWDNDKLPINVAIRNLRVTGMPHEVDSPSLKP